MEIVIRSTKRRKVFFHEKERPPEEVSRNGL
jgi:hypothetical protein